MRQHARAALSRGVIHVVQGTVLVTALVAALVVTLVAPAPTSTPTSSATNPPGNNGTVKIAELGDLDAPPDNDPHVGCTFTVEWYDFDEGADIVSDVLFEMHAPTDDVVLDVDGPTLVPVGGDAAGGAGTPSGLDARQAYTLTFHGEPQPQQGYHVQLTVHTPGSKGNDTKHKTFWVQGCQAAPPAQPAIHLEKSVTDSADADSMGSLGEQLTYAFTVTNTGNTVLAGVTISDDMLDLDGAACVATLAPGGSATCPQHPTYAVTAADVSAGHVSNTATATGTPPDGPEVTDDDDATIATGDPEPQEADLSLVKTASVAIAAPGDQVTYTLKAVNAGTADAEDVVVTDPLPAGTTYVSSSPACANSSGVVTCALGDVPAGEHAIATITVHVDPLPTVTTTHDHQLDVTKIESHLSVWGGDTGGASAQCPAGYLATDGSVRLDHVDQGTGTFDDAMVLRSEATADGRGWAGTVRNDTTGQLQAKVNVVCLSDHTVSGEDHSHPVLVSDPITTTETFAAGRHEADLTCGPGSVAITPGYSFLSGDGVVTGRQTTAGRHFRIRGEHAGQVTLTARCLRTTLGDAHGHGHELAITNLAGHAVVGPHGIEERSLTCRNGAKGIVAWVEYDGDPLGTDPQPVTRLFRLYNPTGAPLDVDYGLLCIDVRTVSFTAGPRTVDNTAIVTTTSDDASTSDDTDTATITVSPTGVSTASSASVSGGARPTVALRVSSGLRRTVRLMVIATQRVAGTHVRKGTVLAAGTAKVHGTGKVVHLTATRAGRAALRADQVHRARLVVAGAHGTHEASAIRLR